MTHERRSLADTGIGVQRDQPFVEYWVPWVPALCELSLPVLRAEVGVGFQPSLAALPVLA
jgi:hypothetical protein